MTIAKSIPRPKNWQDFERLCKKLFGEMFDCATTIKANGRAGQGQQGVDIYGVAKGDHDYFGIQCKARDDDAAATLTIEDLDAEISKARTFKPALAHFLVATTARKDVVLEQHARERDLASRARGEFTIALYCWEDLAELIDEHRETYRWWVLEKRHKARFGVEVSLGDSNDVILRPKFRRIERRREWSGDGKPHWVTNLGALASQFGPGAPNALLKDVRRNRSFEELFVQFRNTGQEVLEDYRFKFLVRGEQHRLDTGRHFFRDSRIPTNTWVDETRFGFAPHDGRPLTQSDSRQFSIFVSPDPASSIVEIDWELFARDFHTQGELRAAVHAEFETVRRVELVQIAGEAGEEESLEDFYAPVE